ncbi:hypothetical protein [Adhaeribacter pallidiroseus]|uniref:DUF4595 domain-containing protein n=1 Tax=Adhaeribacter pallidiroseus TaxID=2072847 RepID=A0A369QHZ8_9BACT|nr:hypothetical protein [Adhaeribacter pallidiroseus]RDC64052.1 hypothetical protein AHMF7616_02662 [Adhaeribacter pallidiroseus]
MKNFSKSIVGAFLFTVLLGLFSCEQEEVKPKPAKAQTTVDADLDNLVYLQHYLIKQNSATLEYDVDHHLQKYKMTPNTYVQYDWYTENNSMYLSSKRYIGGKLNKKVVYSLNSSNKAIKSLTTLYALNGAVVKTEIHGFEYNSSTGKLKKIYNPDPNIKETTTFNYNSSGDIVNITYHHVPGGIKIINDYWYTNTDFPSPKIDKYHFNAEIENLDFYPAIFGSFSKHLPMRTRNIKVVNNNLTQAYRKYKYAFDQKGYVTNRKIMKASDNSLISSDDFEYLVVPVVM